MMAAPVKLDTYRRDKKCRIRRNRYGALRLDVGPYRDLVARWVALGWSYRAIAMAADMRESTVRRILGQGTGAKINRWVSRESAAKLLGADFGAALGHHQAPMYVVARRLQGLGAIGWTWTELAAEPELAAIDMPAASLSRLACRKYRYTRPATTGAVVALFDRLQMTPGTGPRAGRARHLAAAKGWAPPMAWDDMDDPDAIPKGARAGQPGASAGYTNADDLVDAAERGAPLADLCARFALKPVSVYGALRRADRPDLWARLSKEANHAA